MSGSQGYRKAIEAGSAHTTGWQRPFTCEESKDNPRGKRGSYHSCDQPGSTQEPEVPALPGCRDRWIPGTCWLPDWGKPLVQGESVSGSIGDRTPHMLSRPPGMCGGTHTYVRTYTKKNN